MEQNEQPQQNQQQSQPEQTAQEVTLVNKQENNSEKKEDSNVIFVGSKPIINYIRSISVQMSKQVNGEVVIRSRGKYISRAVDIAEIARRKFLDKEGVKIKDIKIGSEEFEKEGRKMNVSTMDIVIGK